MQEFDLVAIQRAAHVSVAVVFVVLTTCEPLRMMMLDPFMPVADPPIAIMPYAMFVVVANNHRRPN